jgi:hypothetical protein
MVTDLVCDDCVSRSSLLLLTARRSSCRVSFSALSMIRRCVACITRHLVTIMVCLAGVHAARVSLGASLDHTVAIRVECHILTGFQHGVHCATTGALSGVMREPLTVCVCVCVLRSCTDTTSASHAADAVDTNAHEHFARAQRRHHARRRRCNRGDRDRRAVDTAGVCDARMVGHATQTERTEVRRTLRMCIFSCCSRLCSANNEIDFDDRQIHANGIAAASVDVIAPASGMLRTCARV